MELQFNTRTLISIPFQKIKHAVDVNGMPHFLKVRMVHAGHAYMM